MNSATPRIAWIEPADDLLAVALALEEEAAWTSRHPAALATNINAPDARAAADPRYCLEGAGSPLRARSRRFCGTLPVIWNLRR
jgi:hypothetical protein